MVEFDSCPVDTRARRQKKWTEVTAFSPECRRMKADKVRSIRDGRGEGVPLPINGQDGEMVKNKAVPQAQLEQTSYDNRNINKKKFF